MLPHWSLVCPVSSLVTISYFKRPLSHLEEQYTTFHVSVCFCRLCSQSASFCHRLLYTSKKWQLQTTLEKLKGRRPKTWKSKPWIQPIMLFSSRIIKHFHIKSRTKQQWRLSCMENICLLYLQLALARVVLKVPAYHGSLQGVASSVTQNPQEASSCC